MGVEGNDKHQLRGELMRKAMQEPTEPVMAEADESVSLIVLTEDIELPSPISNAGQTNEWGWGWLNSRAVLILIA